MKTLDSVRKEQKFIVFDSLADEFWKKRRGKGDTAFTKNKEEARVFTINSLRDDERRCIEKGCVIHYV